MDSKTQHTPGPFRANNLLIEVANGMALDVATVKSPGIGNAPATLEEARATAKLFAAAPELLEALIGLQGLAQLLADNCSDRLDTAGDPRLAAAIDAIAKATGSAS